MDYFGPEMSYIKIMNLKYFLLAVFAFTFFQINAQRRGDIYNRLGIQAGLTYGGIQTEDFKTSNRYGFIGGLTTRATVYNNFLVIYGVNFFQSNTGMHISETASGTFSEIDFKATGVQLNLFVGHKIFGENLSIEIGPVLQVNSKWKPDRGFEDYYVEGYDIQAKDLEEISKVNLNAAVNISTGFRSLKFWFQYQYGVNNIFGKLNSGDLRIKDSRAADLNGHMGLAAAGIVIYL